MPAGDKPSRKSAGSTPARSPTPAAAAAAAGVPATPPPEGPIQLTDDEPNASAKSQGRREAAKHTSGEGIMTMPVREGKTIIFSECPDTFKPKLVKAKSEKAGKGATKGCEDGERITPCAKAVILARGKIKWVPTRLDSMSQVKLQDPASMCQAEAEEAAAAATEAATPSPPDSPAGPPGPPGPPGPSSANRRGSSSTTSASTGSNSVSDVSSGRTGRSGGSAGPSSSSSSRAVSSRPTPSVSEGRAGASSAPVTTTSEATTSGSSGSKGGSGGSTATNSKIPTKAATTAAAAAASELRLDLLTEKDWKLPQWRNLQGADTALVNFLAKAGNSDVLRTQLDRGIRRLSDLPVKDDNMKVFREGYKGVRELGLEVEAGERGKGEFASQLLALLAHAEGTD